MKRLLIPLFLVLLMMSIPVIASASTDLPASISKSAYSSSAGGWTVASARYSFLSSGQQKVFDKAVKDLGGVSYKPVALVARQTVAGTNYVFLCQGTTVTKNPVKSWYVLTVSKSLKNKVTLLSTKKIKISGIKTNRNPRKGNTAGGLQVVPVKNKPEALSAAARKIYRKGTKDYAGYDLRPIALLGTQIVSGTNYRYLCYGAGIGTDSASKDLFVVDIYKDADGKCAVRSCKPIKLEDYTEMNDGMAVGAAAFPCDGVITSPNGKSVDFKKQANTNCSNVDFVGDNGKLKVGTIVKVLGTYKGWCHCEYGGKTGWIMAEYIKLSSKKTDDQAP